MWKWVPIICLTNIRAQILLYSYNSTFHSVIFFLPQTGFNGFYSIHVTCWKYPMWYRQEDPSLPLQWRHNGCDSVSNHQPHDCLLNRLFRRRSKKASKLRVTGLCAGNSPGTGEFPAQMASYAENVSIWWRHHGFLMFTTVLCNGHGQRKWAHLIIHDN